MGKCRKQTILHAVNMVSNKMQSAFRKVNIINNYAISRIIPTKLLVFGLIITDKENSSF